jgi:Protein of unknown function (DUF3025)
VAFGLEAIDWSAPWLAHVREVGQPLTDQVVNATGAISVSSVLNAAETHGVRAAVQFVPQSELPTSTAYEKYIFDTGRVPTRDGLHDFFNGLCWLHFPLTKARLNQLQAAQIAQTGIQPVRGPARDALTVFDENAAFFQGPDALWNALVAKDWTAVFGTLRPLWVDSTLVLFGHALMEKLVYPRKPITAHVFRAQAATNSIADIDVWLAGTLSAPMLAAKPFAHLPVLGVPGWWHANDEAVFYLDASVFRAPSFSGSNGLKT